MNSIINQALPNQKDFTPVKQNFTAKIEIPEVINIKDEKKLSKTSSKPSKSKPIDFVEEKNDDPAGKNHLNLSTHKIISTTSKVIEEKISKKISEKTVINTVGKAVNSVVKTSGETFGKTLLKSIGRNTAETSVASIAEELTLKTIEKSAEKAGQKGSSQLSKKLSGAVPVIGTIMEIGFTLWDAKYAYDLTRNKNVSTVSKALAWGTVGLDVVSAITVATGVGSPVGWAATGLSVGTAVLSDLLR